MNCRAARAMLTRLADGELPSDQKQALTSHIGACPACASLSREAAGLADLLRSPVVPDPGERYWRELSESVRRRLPDVVPGKRAMVCASRFAFVCGGALVLAVCLIAALARPRTGTVLGDTMKAMGEVQTYHSVATGEQPSETWYWAGHGVRMETPCGVYLSNTEGTWEYDRVANEVVMRGWTIERGFMLGDGIYGDWWFEVPERHPSDYRVTVLDDHLDGKPVRRLELELRSVETVGAVREGFSLWVDPDTMRVAVNERWAVGNNGRVVRRRTRYEYDMAVDPAVFEPDFPPDAKVTDTRPVHKLITDALETLRELPFHEVGRWEGADINGRYDFAKSRGTWEAWSQAGVGYRKVVEGVWDGAPYTETTGATLTEKWRYTDKRSQIWHEGEPAFVHAPGNVTHPRVVEWLEVLQMQRDIEVVPVDWGAQAAGRDLVRLSHSIEQIGERRVCTFDRDAARLIGCVAYVRQDGEWHLIREFTIDYPDELPESIFEFDPPPTAVLKYDTVP